MVDWHNKRVVIIGAARQGVALARYLANQKASVVITDKRTPEELEEERKTLKDIDIEWVLGSHPLSLLNGCDVLCPSGGVPLTIPLVEVAKDRGILLSNDSQIFLEEAPCRVIGITGSAGKTTTTTLLGQMAEAFLGQEKTWVGGNIGNPLISNLKEMRSDHLAVVELSSFQLEIMTRAPQVAAVLNITPNHLDRHKTMKAYTSAKAQILHHQTKDDIAVLSRDDPGSWGLRDFVRGKLYAFGIGLVPESPPGVYLKGNMISFWDGEVICNLFPRDLIKIRGEHNLTNVLAACALGLAVDLSQEALQQGVDGFIGVEHRMELVREWGGAEWYNDSIATAPERSMAAIRSFDQPLILLAGGQDKDLPWDEFASLVKNRVDHLVIFGEAREIISKAIGTLNGGDRPYSVDNCENLKDAVRVAASYVQPGDVVLLSPGGTSFDEFNDFAERGDCFRKWVNELP